MFSRTKTHHASGRVAQGVGGERKEEALGQGQRRESASDHPGRRMWKQVLRATLRFLFGVLWSVRRSPPSMRTCGPAGPDSVLSPHLSCSGPMDTSSAPSVLSSLPHVTEPPL